MQPADRLVVFSRFPVPGQAKTRMIPALGARGAAELQEIMTGRTVLRARAWAATGGAQIELRHTGAPARAFGRWLGPDLQYTAQGKGDLGARMARAVAAACAAGARRVVLIGCDCPGLDASTLSRAFAALEDADVVIGPAADGGYTLIGMKAEHPPLFQGIPWGTAEVRERTRRTAQRLGLRVAELDTLADVDMPEDLAVWESSASAAEKGGLSVIIPALDEAAEIAACVRSARPGAWEVILADGGSRDGTPEAARRAGARVLGTPRGRARQMNAAAQAARGDLLLFLHADTRLPTGYAGQVKRLLTHAETVGGAFRLRIGAPGFKYRAVEAAVHMRCALDARPYGDQAIFLRRDTFLRIGGYADLPILEDLDLVRRLGRRGRIRTLALPVHTSARRWKQRGVLRTTLLHQQILLGYSLGLSPDRMSRWRRRLAE